MKPQRIPAVEHRLRLPGGPRIAPPKGNSIAEKKFQYEREIEAMEKVAVDQLVKRVGKIMSMIQDLKKQIDRLEEAIVPQKK